MEKILNIITYAFAALLLGILALLSVRGIVDPTGAANAFGLPVTDPVAEFYHAVYRDRNLAIALTGILFLVTKMWRALAMLATVAISLPVYDIYALKAAGIAIVPVHIVTLVALVILTILLWLRVDRERRNMRGG